MGFNLADAIKKKKEEEKKNEEVSGFEDYLNKKNEIWENTPNKGFTPSKPVTGSSAPFANIEEDKDEDEGFNLSKALDRYKAGEVAEGLNERINSYFNNFDSFAQDYSNRVSGFTGEYTDSYVSDASDWMSAFTTRGNDLQAEAYNIVSILDTYSDYYNPDFVQNAKKAIFDSLGIKNDMGESATSFAEYWNQWKDEGAYKKWQEAYEADQKLLNTPLSGVKLGIQQLEKDMYDLKAIYNDYEVALLDSKTKDGDYQLEGEFIQKLWSYAKRYGYDTGFLNNKSGIEGYGALVGLFNEDLANRRVLYRNAETRQTQEKLSATAKNASDFEEYAQIGLNWNDGKSAFSSDLNEAVAYRGGSPINRSERAQNIWRMTDEEVKIYSYWFAKEGKDKAEEYLESIVPTIEARTAGKLVDAVGDSKTLSLILKAASGLEQWSSGLEGAWNMVTGKDIYIPPSSTQIAASSEEINENLPGGWGVAGDLIQTTANQLPSIMMSFVPVVGQGLSLASMGISASGNAYNEMIGLGYSEEQARGYGLLVGGSEVLLGSLLDGTTKLGGKVVQNLTGKSLSSFLGGIDNAFARVAINTGTRMLSEFTEESLQTVLEPWFKSVVTSTDFEAADWGDILYSGLLGALSAGALGNIDVTSDSTITGAIATTIKGAQVKKVDGGVSRLVKFGSTFSADTVAYKIANKVNDNTDAYTIGRLLNESNATLTEQNKSEIVKSLERKGVATEHANTIANALSAVVEGADLNALQRIGLEANPIIARTIRDVIINPNSTVNQRTKGLSDLANDMSRGKTKASTTDTANAVVGEAKSIEASESAITEESATQGKYEVSADGKTMLKSNSEYVTPVEVESIENGSVRVKLDNGESVDASELSFATSDEALLYEMVTRMGDVAPQTATALIKNFKATDGVSAQTYALDIPLAYQYGKINYAKGLENLDLTIDQRQVAFHHGRNYADAEVKAKQTAITEKGTMGSAENATATKGKGGVRFEKGATAKTKAQKKAVSLAKHLAKAMGIDIVFYDARTTTDENGKGANGYFDERTNSIHLDLQNSADDAKTIVFTMAHELTHFIKKWSPAKFKVFADFLMEQYGDTTVTLEAKMEQLGTTDADLAYEEMICDACETMLLDSNAVVKLMQLRATDLDLFEKIKLHVLELLNKIRTEYKKLGLEPTSDEAKALLKMEGVLEKLSAMFEEAAVDAVQNYQAVESLETDSVSVSEDGTIRMQMKQYQQTGRATLLRYLTEQYGNKNANDLIATIDNIYNVLSEVKQNEALSVFSNWQDTEVELDENGHPIFTTSVNNGDYELNQDFSRVCKKRRQLDFVLNMLAEDPAFEASNLTKQDFVKINKAIKKHGFEIACALCFVDSKRFRQAEWADSFANTWNDILNAVVKDSSKLTPFNFATKNPNIADDGIEIDTSKSVMYRKWSDGKEDVKNRRTYESFDQMLSKDNDGKWLEGNTNVRTIATLIRDNPELRHTFRGADIIGSQGFDTIQRLAPKIRSILDGWGGSSVPKPSSNDASYDSSIINMSKYNKETAYAMGGVRMNSFSDFMAHMFFDYCQAFADLSAKELPSQAYTKELDYVRLFGRSGQKQNMSGIAAIRDNALPTTASKKVTKAEAEANEKIEKMIAGLDVTRLLEHLNKDIYQLTESDVEQFLDMCDYVWADESINMKHATLLQTGILYDKLSESKIEECYELLKAGEVEQALKVAGEENVDREYAKHCGTIVVGVSDAHIRKLLRDPTVRMVIPYHKSGLNPVIARELRIAAYNDYTLTQTTGVKRKGTKTSEKIGSTAIKDAYGLKDFAFYDWFGKTIDGKLYDGKATADKYLEWCEKGYYDENVGDYVYYTTKGDGYILASEFHKKASIIPKFDTFASEENYYKLLEDFDCYDTITGEHSAQGAVDFLRVGLPSDYKDVLIRSLKAEQQVADDFKDHLDNKGLKDEVMEIVKARGYTPSENGIKKQAKKTQGNIYDYSKSFAEQIDDYKKGLIPQNDTLLVSGTPEVWKKVGFNALPVTINQKHVDYALNGTKDADHHIGETLLKDLPNAIKTPIAIIQSQSPTSNDRAVVILKMTHAGKNVIAAVEVDGYGRTNNIRIDSNAMASLFAKSNALTQLNKAINNTVSGGVELFYWNKKEAVSLLQRAGLQLSSGLPQDGFVHSIHDNGSNVNTKFENITETQQFKRWFGDWQKNPEKASKIVNGDGTPMIVYHGSNADFTVFDKSKIGSGSGGSFGQGFYFSTDPRLASHYGDNVGEYYLNIKNPFDYYTTNKEYLIDMLEKSGYEYDRDFVDAYDAENLWTDDLIDDFLSEALKGKDPYVELSQMLQNAKFDGIWTGEEIIAFEPTQIKSATDNIGTFDPNNPDIRYQKKRNPSTYAPTFYSQMGREIDAIKMDKIGASSLVNYLKGKGIKHDEIKWSGIEAFLEGKKSVTKAELQEFIAGSQLEIVEQVSGEDIDLRYNGSERAYTLYDDNGNAIDTFTYNEFMGGYVAESDEEIYSNELELKESLRDVYGKNSSPKWADYSLDGGTNYREIVFQLPESTYSNRAMRVHWGQDSEGILVHARIQDMTTADGKKMLFIEELQSDWHNEGHEKGYSTKEYEDAVAVYDKLAEDYANKRRAFNKYVRSGEFRSDPDDVSKKKFDWLRRKMDEAEKRMQDAERDIEALKKKGMGDVQDAPFRDTYHEYVLKRLLRMAAEEGYDSIGWTPAWIQSDRWSEDYAEAYRIEYDQEMPKFLRKYGKKWGATVGKADIGVAEHTVNGEHYDAENIEVWSMDITKSMEQSVLYEGQAKFQKKRPSNRTILANTLENAIDTSTQEGQNELRLLKDYQSKIDLIEKEEAHLAEVKSEIAEISFNKGTDRSKLNGLNAEKTRTANRINTYDKQLTRLEAMKPIKDVLDREKEMVRKRTEQKGKERLSAYKEKVAETQRELLTRWQESRKNAVEGRNKTEMRHKIKGIVADLNKLLLDPSKDKHVPIGLQRPVAEALDIINMDTVGAEERVAKYNELIAKAKDPVEIERLTKTRDRIELQGANLADKLASLKNAYAEFKESDDPLIRNAHNEAIENLIAETVKTAGNTPIRDMSLNQLEAVYDMYKAILATVRNANKMFKADRQATVSEHSEAVKVEVKEVGGHNDKVRKSTKGIKSFVWELLKPIAAFKHIGSETLSKLFDNVRAGEDTYAMDLSEAKEFFTEQSAKYHYDSWDFKKRYTFKDTTGLEFSLTLDQIMSLYAYSKRNQADRHLEVGGFVFDDAIEVIEKNKLGIPVKYEVNDANPYRLDKMALGEIISSLTSEQKAFIDQMQTYLSDVMGAKGNEISLAMYDIKLYKEKHYFPLKTSRYFREFNPEQSGNPMLRNAGFSKKTVPQAGNPIVLSNFMDVWGGHVNDMSMYHSFVLPLEDFMRVYNYSSTAGGYDSVQQYIKNAYGSQANHYVEKLMQDINGGVVSGTLPNGWLKMFGKFKKTMVAASMSTIVQQPTAVLRAMGKINPIHFVGVPINGGHKKTWNKIKTYAPVAIIKEMGGIDVGSGRQATDFITAENYKGLGKIKGFFTDSDYRDSIFMWGATKADELGWNTIWRAVEREVASEKKFKPGTEEFYKAVGERFTEIITETQVYDSVFSRSGIMRDKGDLNKFATSFMGEPITSLNMIYSAILDAKRGGSKAQAVREIGSVYVSIVAASALASVIYALRDDDEDEAYLEKWAEAFGNKLSSEVWIHNMIPYIRDVASIIEGWDVERPDMSIFTDIKSSFDKLYKINEDGEFEWRVDFSDPASVYSAIENFGGSIASAFGLPVKNIMRDTRGIFNGFKAMTDDIHPEDVKGAFVQGWSGEEKDKNEKLYEAIVNGDEGRLAVYRNTYKTEEAYETALRSALREHDPRIAEAAQALIDGDIAEYTRTVVEIIGEGNFKQDIVVGAIDAEFKAINEAANEGVESSDDEVEAEKATSIYKADYINAALESGDVALAKNIISELIEVKVANGSEESKAKSTIKSSITTYWKPLYKKAYKTSDTSEMRRIREILYATGLYGRANDVVKTVQDWLKED